MAAPTVTSISPSVGGTIGGAAVTIVGTGFSTATGVTIGGVACTSFVAASATTITCVTPAGSGGAASVVVTNPDGSNGANTLFFYVSKVPTDTYIYLKGGRGDGFVPTWTGEYRDSVEEVKSDPYRDIFPSTKITRTWDGGILAIGTNSNTLKVENSFMAADGDAAEDGGMNNVSKLSDEVAHTEPRQYLRKVTFRHYLSSNGIEYHFELAQITGVGSEPRDE